MALVHTKTGALEGAAGCFLGLMVGRADGLFDDLIVGLAENGLAEGLFGLMLGLEEKDLNEGIRDDAARCIATSCLVAYM
jgi:hypothetical protein